MAGLDGGAAGGRHRFLLVNALDGRLPQFLYPAAVPQGLLVLEAGLRAGFPGLETRILPWDAYDADAAFGRLDRLLEEFRPGAVGLSAYTHMMPLASEIAARVRRRDPSIPIVLGGVHPTAFPDGIARHPEFDFYVRHEGVRVAPRLLRHLLLGEPGPDGIPSIAFRRDGRAVVTPAEVLPEDMDLNPQPDWSILRSHPARDPREVRLDEYWCLVLDAGTVYPYETSQGCNKRCTFCARINGTASRAYSVGRVVSDFEALRDAIDARIVFVNDEHSHHRPGRLEALLDALAASRDRLGLRYYVAVRAGEVERGLIDRMVDAGVAFLHVFPESGSPRIRAEMCKDLDLDRLRDNVSYASARGLFVMAGFIAGWPGETPDEIESTLALAADPMFDFVFMPPLVCLARSGLRRHLRDAGIEPDTPAYYEYLTFQRQLVLADYGPDAFVAYLRRVPGINAAKMASPATRAKLAAAGCRIEARPLSRMPG